MFTIHMPLSFKVGDTEDVRINKKPRRLTWRDEQTLVINDNDVRAIINTHVDGDLRGFVCVDPGKPVSHYGVEGNPDGSGNRR